MQKIIFKFTMALASAIASHAAAPRRELPKPLKPEINIEPCKAAGPAAKGIVANEKTVLS